MKAPSLSWFPICPRTYLAEYIVGMTPEQAGAYTFLVLAAWLSTPPASLPNDDTTLARLAGFRDDVAAWGKVKPVALAGWTCREDGRVSLFWLKQVYDDATCKCRKNRMNGGKGGEANAKRLLSERQATGKRSLDTCVSPSDFDSGSKSSEGMQGEPPREAVLSLPEGLDTPEFRSAWADYEAHRREKGVGALKPRSVAAQFDRLKPMGSQGAVAAIRLSIASGWTGIFPEKPNGKAGSNGGGNQAGAHRAAKAAREYREPEGWDELPIAR